MLIAAAFTYGLIMFAFMVAAVVRWFSWRARIKPFTRLAVYVAAAYVALGIGGMALEGGPNTPTLGGAWAFTLDFVRVMTFTAVGAHCCALAGWRPFASPVGRALPQPEAQAGQLLLRLVLIGLFVAAWASYTQLLFWAFSPQPSEHVVRAWGLDGDDAAEVLTPIGVALIGLVAVGEELVFRLGIQNLLATWCNWWGRKYWLAIVATSALWTVGHAGTLDPDWVKFLQIFPVGVALGWLFRKHGIESCIAVHVLFNILASYWLELP